MEQLEERREAANNYVSSIMPPQMSLSDADKSTMVDTFLAKNDKLPFTEFALSNLRYMLKCHLKSISVFSRDFGKPSDYTIRTYVPPSRTEFGDCNPHFGTAWTSLIEGDDRIHIYKRWRMEDRHAQGLLFVRNTEPDVNPARCAREWTTVKAAGGWSFLGKNGGLVESFRGFEIVEGFEFPGACKPEKLLLYLGGREYAELPVVNGTTVSDALYVPFGCMSHIHCCFRFVFSEENPFRVEDFQVNVIVGESDVLRMDEGHFHFVVGGSVVKIAERFWASITPLESADVQ
jgi:hypothetical protein